MKTLSISRIKKVCREATDVVGFCFVLLYFMIMSYMFYSFYGVFGLLISTFFILLLIYGYYPVYKYRKELQQKYDKDEITKEEYERLRRDLAESAPDF